MGVGVGRLVGPVEGVAERFAGVGDGCGKSCAGRLRWAGTPGSGAVVVGVGPVALRRARGAL